MQSSGFYCSSGPQSKNKRKLDDKTNNWPSPENWKKLWNMRVTEIHFVDGALGMVPQSMEKTGGAGNQ